MSDETTIDENKLIAERRSKLKAIREQRIAYPNDIERSDLAQDVIAKYDEHDSESLESTPVRVAIAGRMMVKRVMGKASFAKLADRSGELQVYIQRDALPEGRYAEFKTWDIGDIVAAEGELFRTRTNELTVKVDALRLVTKSLRPLPEKWHGLSD